MVLEVQILKAGRGKTEKKKQLTKKYIKNNEKKCQRKEIKVQQRMPRTLYKKIKDRSG